MNNNRAVRISSFLVIQVFLFALLAYAQPSNRSIFKDKKVDYKTMSDKQEKELEEKRSALKGKTGPASIISQSAYKETRVLMNPNALKDITSIYIPESIGKVVEAYEAPNSKRLVAHIQDMHCNPEAAFNLANILEILTKDYGLSLVCSEGAEGAVDTSSVSSFPDAQTREKVAKLFVNSGELTGEEYLSITKYPNLPIWGIENKDIYFENIAEFNKIMEFNQASMDFINKAGSALEALKPKVYSPKLLELAGKYAEYEKSQLDTSNYLDYLIKLNPSLANKYNNIAIFRETLNIEKGIDQEKIIEESQGLLTDLRSAIDPKNNQIDFEALAAKAGLFKEKKISPHSFYSYIDELSKKYLKNKISSYPAVVKYIDYLDKLNSLDSLSLFQEIDLLTYETKDLLSDSPEQKDLTRAIRNLKVIDELFNVSVSNEGYAYYLSNKEDCKVSFFKSVITSLTGSMGKNSQLDIDYNPALIDNHLSELEHFYDIAYKRDIEMSKNALKKIEESGSKVSAIVTGGFHSYGITKSLKEAGYSYIVISPYAKTGIDEENYRFLLSGKRRPIEELIKEMNEEQE